MKAHLKVIGVRYTTTSVSLITHKFHAEKEIFFFLENNLYPFIKN